MDFALARGVEVVGVRGPGVDVLHDGEQVEDVLLAEDVAPVAVGAVVQLVLLQLQLDANLLAEGPQHGDLLEAVGLADAVNAVDIQVEVVVGHGLVLDQLPEALGGQGDPVHRVYLAGVRAGVAVSA